MSLVNFKKNKLKFTVLSGQSYWHNTWHKINSDLLISFDLFNSGGYIFWSFVYLQAIDWTGSKNSLWESDFPKYLLIDVLVPGTVILKDVYWELLKETACKYQNCLLDEFLCNVHAIFSV